MISRIETIQHLRLEIIRRKTLRKKQAELIENDFSELKQALQPINLLQNIMRNRAIITTLLSSTTFFGLSVAARKTLLRKTSGLFKKGFGFILSKLTSRIASEASQTIFSKLQAAFSNLKRSASYPR